MSLYDIDLTTLDGKPQTMAAFRGRTLLIVNVASHCGYTSQYAGLQALHNQYKDRNFAVLGFPCDQFGHQEPGTEAEIASFCEHNYGVNFPMYAKIEVNGANAHPLYALLKSGQGGSDPIKWNFTKFLVGPEGTVEKRYASGDSPEAIGKELEARLK